MPKSPADRVCELFYGYPVEEIMRVCLVSEATARHFKRGTRTPSPQSERLWQLHIDGRVLGPEWGRYRVYRDEMIDPDGLVYKAGEIASIPFLHAQIAELRKQLDKARYVETLGELGFFELTDSLRVVLEHGAKLLTAVEKIPRRKSAHDSPREPHRPPGKPSQKQPCYTVGPDSGFE